MNPYFKYSFILSNEESSKSVLANCSNNFF